MKITIEADSKEIADLVLGVQNRRIVEKTVEVELYPKNFSLTHVEAIRDMRKDNSAKPVHIE